jgi:hypothetical protein
LANITPTASLDENIFQYLVSKIHKLTFKKIFDHLLTKVRSTYLGVRSADFIFVGGKKSLTKTSLMGKNTEVLWIHTFDYDIYLKNRGTKEEKTDTVVFLDEYLPFHPDYAHTGTNPPATPNEYYPLLCKIFDYVEGKLGLKVVIAAHPRSHYDKLPDFFRGRKVIRGKTIELVKDSNFVIMHCSTAINFVVMHKKPILFITFDKLVNAGGGKDIHYFASFFKKKPINISKEIDIDLKDEIFIYEECYSKYKQDFIKIDGTEETPFWQVVANKIKFLHRDH